MVRKARFITTTALAGLVIAQMYAADDQAKGAKELFYAPPPEMHVAPGHAHDPKPVQVPTYDAAGRRTPHSTDPARQRLLGLSYWIELVDASGNPIGPVTDERTFHSGDRIRLHFRSNTDGRILLVQLGSSGTSGVLFPDPEKGLTENAVVAQADYVLPTSTHWFKFDASPGTEKLLVLFARSQPELDHAFPTRTSMDAAQTAELLQVANHVTGGKDLLIETETHQTAEVGTYAVSVAGKPIVVQIVLKHK
jgi:hypothetical protein